MRFIAVVLLMAVFFLLGIVYANNPSGEMFGGWKEVLEGDHEAEIAEPAQKKPEVQTSALKPVDVEQTPHFTQKMASSLETVVTGFYDGVVDVLYTFTEAFF